MLYDTELHGRAVLPTDITLRTPIYRRHGIVASVLSAAVTLAFGPVRRRSSRNRGGNSPPLSTYLRRDNGLPPEHRNPVWDDIRWK